MKCGIGCVIKKQKTKKIGKESYTGPKTGDKVICWYSGNGRLDPPNPHV